MLTPNLTDLFSSSVLSTLVDQITLISSTSPSTSTVQTIRTRQPSLCLLTASVLLLFQYSTLCSAASASEDILTNHIGVHDNQIITYLTRNSNLCPKWLNCTENYFDEGKDCHESGNSRIRCNCIAHCCLAFDCRNWGHLVQCRRKCGATPNRFGLRRTERLDCEKYHCERHFFDQAWDARGAHSDAQRNCIGHCCYAFDCRRTLGYCRHACGVDAWVTARPLG